LETLSQPDSPTTKNAHVLRIILYVCGTLILFFFALDMMMSSFQHLGKDAVQTIIQLTLNPFTGLFIGLLITAMIQSSSTTTAIVVAMVASGSLTLQSAIPMIMGANVGTTITSTIVSLGFISKKKEFRRAVSTGTYHCFFNLLTVLILFPLEYYYSLLTVLSTGIAYYIFNPSSITSHAAVLQWSGLNPFVDWLADYIPGFILILISFALLFGSILLFRKVISNLLKAKSPEAFSRFFFKNPMKSFGWGLLTTAAIRSSTITTSVVVPIVAKKIVTLKEAAPFIMGANVGTTITAFIAVLLNANASEAISIAIAHFLFNVFGVILFFPIPVLRKIPIKLASGLGKLTLRYPLVCFLFILVTFFFIPFSLIYLNQNTQKVLDLTYERTAMGEKSYYRVKMQWTDQRGTGYWTKFDGLEKQPNEEPAFIYPLHYKNNSLFIGDQLYLLNKPGFCWDDEDENGKYKACVEKILPTMRLGTYTFDSVYVFDIHYVQTGNDSIRKTIYLGGAHCIVLQLETRASNDSIMVKESLIELREK
jgi:sodium-dependent phosphate cotransporter